MKNELVKIRSILFCISLITWLNPLQMVLKWQNVLNQSIHSHSLEFVSMHIAVWNWRWLTREIRRKFHFKKLIWVVFNEICDRLCFGSEIGWNNKFDEVSINVWIIWGRWCTGRIFEKQSESQWNEFILD